MDIKLIYVLQAHSNFPGKWANNFQVFKMCSAFSKYGIETTLLATNTNKAKRRYSNFKDTIWEYYGVNNRFNIDWINFNYPNIKFKQFFHGFVSSMKLRNKTFSIIYTRSEWVAIFSSILTQKKIVLELHNFKNTFSQKIIAKLSKINNDINVVSITKALKKELINYGFNKNIIVSHDAVDLDMFNININPKHLKNYYGIQNSNPIITHVGSIRKGRGFKTIVETAKRMKNCSFVFVCGHEEDVKIIDRQKNKKISNIIFIDFLPNSKIPEVLKMSDILLMSYTSDLETLRFTSPLKMFEYMASKKPIISSDFPVLREVLNDNNSLLIRESDPISLEIGINKILSDKFFANKIANNAQIDVKKYTWDSRAKKIIDSLNV